MLQSSDLVSLKLTGEDHLHCITKCSIAVAVALGHGLVVGMMMLVQKAVGSSIEGEWNLLNINDFSTSCMLLTD